LSDLDSDPNYQQIAIVSLLNTKIFNWPRFLVLMHDIESKKLEFFTNLVILGYIKIVKILWKNSSLRAISLD